MERLDSGIADLAIEDVEEETMSERLWGLTEMFPEVVRRSTAKVASLTSALASIGYHYSREIVWIVASSAMITVLPIALQIESMQIQEAQIAQQRNILLGPKASGAPTQLGPGSMPMMPPPPPK